MKYIDIFTIEDTYVFTGLQQTKFYGSPTLKVGYNSNNLQKSSGYYYTLIKFDLTKIPANTTILETYLSLYISEGFLESDKSILSINRNLENYDANTVTQNSAPKSLFTGISHTITQKDFKKYIKIDISSLLDDWRSKTYPNYGVTLGISGFHDNISFNTSSNENPPYLSISYINIVGYTGLSGPTGPTGPAGPQGPAIGAFGSVYYLGPQQIIASNNPIIFNAHSQLFTITHTPGDSKISILANGLYQVNYFVSFTRPTHDCSIALSVNGTIDVSSQVGSTHPVIQLYGVSVLVLKAGSILTLVNTSQSSITLTENPNVGSQLTILRVALTAFPGSILI